MRSIIVFIIFSLTVNLFAQSGRVNPNDSSNQPNAAENPVYDLTAKEMFDEANTYAKVKFADFETKKIPFSDKLYQQTLLERRQLAAKYATLLGARDDLAGNDFYFLGMLHWIAENTDGTAAALEKFIAVENPEIQKLQTARSMIVFVAARQKNFEAAEKFLNDYLKTDPVRTSERVGMENELAKAYKEDKKLGQAAKHGEEYYRAAKAAFKEAASRTKGLNEIYDAGITLFEIYKEDGKQKEALNTLEDLRKTAAFLDSNLVYYAAVDRSIKYLIETGRKAEALQFYTAARLQVSQEVKSKPLQTDILRRLKERENQYKLLGERAIELTDIDKWLPGKAQTFNALRGKVVVLDFWATWCGPCLAAFPSINEWHETFEKDGLVILGITRYYGEYGGFSTAQEELDFMQEFRKKYDLKYDFVIAKGQANQIAYSAMNLPTTVLIDRQGVIRYIETGTSATREEEIREEIVKLLAEKQ